MNTKSMNTDWINRDEYPFISHFIQSRHGRIHYIDEGEGEILLFVHGNPNWSFGYRELIKHFSKEYRCIAIDHIGFGLSDKPYEVSYRPQFHAENLEWFINELQLKGITLILHDWGGPIAMSYAENHSHNVKRIVAFNSWFWSIKGERTLELFSTFMGSSLVRNLCRYFNFFPRVLMKTDVGDKSRFPHSIHQHYIKPFPNPDTRKGTWIFPKSFLAEDDWLGQLWENRGRLRDIPVLLLWGMKDKAFPEPFLAKWKEIFPNNRVKKFDYSGHNSPEEIGKDAIEPMDDFLNANRREVQYAQIHALSS